MLSCLLRCGVPILLVFSASFRRCSAERLPNQSLFAAMFLLLRVRYLLVEGFAYRVFTHEKGRLLYRRFIMSDAASIRNIVNTTEL
jgi:hypothetical protein